MGNTIKIGGVGKSPAIEKINRLNAISISIDAAIRLEQEVFNSEREKAKNDADRRSQIIQDFSINFRKKNS